MYNTVIDIDPFQIISMERVRKSIINGLPDSLRGDIWCMLCQVKREKAMHSEGFYWKLVDIENIADEHNI